MKCKWMKAIQWDLGRVRITIEIPYNWHRIRRERGTGKRSFARAAALILMAAMFTGCSKQIDRLLGNQEREAPQTIQEWTQEPYYWLYPAPGPSQEFCERYPQLKQCGGDQGPE